jgi:hypothetical protein
MGLTRGAAQVGQKCGRAGEAARTHGRGVSEGGFTWAIPYTPVFSLLRVCQRVVYWLATRAMNLKRRCSNLRHVDKEFYLQNILEELIAQQHKAVWNYPGEIDRFLFF